MKEQYYIFRKEAYARPEIRSGYPSQTAGLLFERFDSREEAVRFAVDIVDQDIENIRDGLKGYSEVIERCRKLCLKLQDFKAELEREL